jgi:hypothetical protein
MRRGLPADFPQAPLERNGLHYILPNSCLEDFDAEVVEALEQAVYGSHSGAAVEVMWTEVLIGSASGQHVIANLAVTVF